MEPMAKKCQLGWPWHRGGWGYYKAYLAFICHSKDGRGKAGNRFGSRSKYISQVNAREGAEVFKLKDDIGTRTNDYKQVKNKYRQEPRNFLTV